MKIYVYMCVCMARLRRRRLGVARKEEEGYTYPRRKGRAPSTTKRSFRSPGVSFNIRDLPNARLSFSFSFFFYFLYGESFHQPPQRSPANGNPLLRYFFFFRSSILTSAQRIYFGLYSDVLFISFFFFLFILTKIIIQVR